jgi:hypothetical protein
VDRGGRTRNPKLHEVDATTEAIEMLIAEGWQWVFIDTGRACDMTWISDSERLSDISDPA